MNKEKSELILKLFDRKISPDEFQLLQDMMRNDPEMKVLYYEHVLLEHSLDGLYGEKILSPTARKNRPAGKSTYKRNFKIASLAAVACVLIGLMTARYLQVPAQSVTAEMRFSENTVWSMSGGGGGDDGLLAIGRELIIESGAVELRLPRGVMAVVEAPAKLVMKDDGELYLSQGRASFTVPSEGVGFTVTTPRLQAVDMGTQFGVVSSWDTQDQIHVIKGTVRVDNRVNKAESARVLHAGDAVSIDSAGKVQAVACRQALYQEILPQSVEILAVDDFELEGLEDGQLYRGVPLGWKRFGDREVGYIGRHNPAGKGKYYHQAGMDDAADRGGVIGGMKGPCLAYFYGIRNGGIERKIGNLSTDSMYTVTLHLGGRDNKALYAGYAISLMSGETVLQTISSREPPYTGDQLKAVTMSWDAANIPKNVYPGDPLSVRIGPYINSGKGLRYLDFDNFRVTSSVRGK